VYLSVHPWGSPCMREGIRVGILFVIGWGRHAFGLAGVGRTITRLFVGSAVHAAAVAFAQQNGCFWEYRAL